MEYINQELMDQAKHWGELIRKESKTAEETALMGMYGASLFLRMMESKAPAMAFDDIIVAASGRINGFDIVELEDIPEEYKDMPLHPMVDPFSMGQRVGTNVYLTFSQHASEHMRYLTVVDTTTGKRIRIRFNSIGS